MVLGSALERGAVLCGLMIAFLIISGGVDLLPPFVVLAFYLGFAGIQGLSIALSVVIVRRVWRCCKNEWSVRLPHPGWRSQ